MKCLTIQINKRNKALSQFKNYNFNSLVKFNGVYLGTNPGGLFRLGNQADTDAGSTINWAFKPVITDFGTDNEKHIVHVYFGLNTASDFSMGATPDNGNVYEYTIPVTNAGRQRVRVTCRSDKIGRYWEFEFSGTADFDMNTIEMLIANLHHGFTKG